MSKLGEIFSKWIESLFTTVMQIKFYEHLKIQDDILQIRILEFWNKIINEGYIFDKVPVIY